MDVHEMKDHLERIARDEDAPPSARIRAIEVIARLNWRVPEGEQEWEDLVRQFGTE